MIPSPNRVVDMIRQLAASPPPYRKIIVDRVSPPKTFGKGVYEFSLYEGEEMVGLVCLSIATDEWLKEVLDEIEAELKQPGGRR